MVQILTSLVIVTGVVSALMALTFTQAVRGWKAIGRRRGGGEAWGKGRMARLWAKGWLACGAYIGSLVVIDFYRVPIFNFARPVFRAPDILVLLLILAVATMLFWLAVRREQGFRMRAVFIFSAVLLLLGELALEMVGFWFVGLNLTPWSRW